MIDLERLADWMTEIRPVRTETGLCLRARSARSGCQSCLDVCPAGAISLARGPAVAPDLCTACGLCTAACRTGALRMETPSPATLLAAARKAQGGPPVLACSREAAELPPAVKGRLVVVPCLGCLTAELLAGMLAAGQERLLLWQPPACETCANGAGSRALVKTAVDAVDGLYPGCIATGSTPALLAAGVAAGVEVPFEGGGALDERLAARDRRAFLTGAVKNAPGLLTLLLGDWLPKAKAEPVRPAPVDIQVAPPRRQMLLEAMADRPPAAAARLPERMAAVTADCTLCPACSRLCPSGSLRLQVDGVAAGLLWQASRCTDCGLCRETCPMGAITQAAPLTAGQFQAGEPLTLMQATQATCECGNTYWRTDGGPARCVACRLQSKG